MKTNNNDGFKIEESQKIPSPQLSKSPPSSPINQDSKETKGEPNNGIINGNKVIIDKSKDNSNNDEFKIEGLQEILSPQLPKSPPSDPINQDSKETKGLQEILSPQLPKSPSSTPINQDNKETKDEPNNVIINENKAIIDKSKDNCSTCALKSYKHSISNMKEVTNELKLLRKVDYHQNIIRFYGVTKNE
ncbi:17073_t:CDS:2, partial [Entrophospora sp. SA101]